MTSVDSLPCFLSEPERKGTGTFNVNRPPSWGIALDSHVENSRDHMEVS